MDQLMEVIKEVVTSLFSCGKEHAEYVYKLEENLPSLNEKWDLLRNICEDVRARIDDAERVGEMQRTKEVNSWLQKVRDLQQVMEDINIRGPKEIHNKCLSGCCPKNCVSSYQLGKEVSKRLSDLDVLLTWGNRFDKNVDIAYKAPPKVVDEIPSAETVGLDLMFNKVWNSLGDENVGIIGLYGMGGAGKTTLMRIIHNEFAKGEHKFELVLWIVVSKDCDINKIMNDMRNRLGVKDDIWDRSSQEQRVTKIYQVLKHKKFVLMLDDLWGKLELEKVGVPLLKDTNNQSKVLFTTRSEDVCDKMQAQKKFKVECLLEQEAFDLFCRKVGEETLTCHGEIKRLAWEIAKQCQGLPLALITVGSAMAGVKNVEAWRQANIDLRSSPFTRPDLEEKVFKILKFSYDKLPDEIHKRCFLYCALYPEDYEIDVDGLIDRWIGEGFLSEDWSKNIYDMYEQGKSIIEKLKLSCLLESVKADMQWQYSWIKMHDVIRDMALWLARDGDGNKDKVLVETEALVTSKMNSKRLNAVERISMTNCRGTWQIPACSNLLTLSVNENMQIIDFSNLQSMTRLKVLDLSISGGNRVLDLPKEIGNLIDLEYLNLSGVHRKIRFPIDSKNLENLRVLLLQDVGLEIIPLEVIAHLKRLKVFRLYRWEISFSNFINEQLFLEILESLPELEELCINLRTITRIKKLFKSAKLRDCSRALYLEQIEDPLDITSLLVSRMEHLNHLSLFQVRNIMERRSSITNTSHLCKLRKVNIEQCGSITHLTWLIRYAPLLETLRVYSCSSVEEVVKGSEDENDGTCIEDDILSNLIFLELGSLPKLKSIHKRPLPFPSLKAVRIQGCPNLRKLPFNSNSAKDSLIAIQGELKWRNNLEWEDRTVLNRLRSKFRFI